MEIAVLLGGAGFDSQKRTINGILESAIQDEGNVYVFAGEGWSYRERSSYEEGEYNIYRLVDFSKYDGVIVNLDTIHDEKVVEEIMCGIREADVPCVSLNIEWEGAICIKMENHKGIAALLEHLINVHQVKTVSYVSGPCDNQDAKERLDAFRKTMDRCRLLWGEEDILYGDYTYESGMAAAGELLRHHEKLPDAVMAANDEMAIGIILSLREHGIRVPEDVMVTGYDDSTTAMVNYPRLTTVKRGESIAAGKAYQILKKMAEGKTVQSDRIVEGIPIFGASCGCNRTHDYTHAMLQEKYVRKVVETDSYLKLIKNSAAEFTGLETFEDFVRVAKDYIRQIDPEAFYLCMCGSIDDYYDELERMAEGQERGRNAFVYREDIWIPLAYESGEFRSYEKFPKNEVLPAECKKGVKGSFYVVMPLHYQKYCFGYCVVKNYRPAIEDRFFQQFVLNLNNALETVRRQDTMRSMLGRLNRMWVLDELTGVHNRAGLRKFGPRVLEEACRKEVSAAAIFVDVDGLKSVNDKYGHEEGDALIRAIAGILEQTRRHGQLLVRYGGDEFVMLVIGYHEQEIQDYIASIHASIKKYNQIYHRSWLLDASIGYYLKQKAEPDDLNRMIELADQDMYRVKRGKKKSGGEAGLHRQGISAPGEVGVHRQE